ncbi:SCO family protein [soil metagenome]
MLIGIAVVAVLVLGIGLGVGLARGDGDQADAWAGVELTEPQPKPAIVLPDTDGRPFDLRAQTAGKLTILFFGYTSCPDICPANLITLDKALSTMPGDVRAAARVVFVSVDPARDSPDVIRSYLDQYDRSFVGLTGTAEQLAEAQDLASVPRATFDAADDSGFYTVGHASQMIAYSPDGSAHIVYPFGTRQVDWSRDLPRLARGETP